MEKQKKIKTGLTLFVLLYVGITINSIYAVEKFSPLNIDQVKIDGEIGRRIDITINNNALVLDADKDFLLPFKQRNRKGGYIGLGKFIDSLVRFAAYTKNEKVLKLKKHIVDETIKTQEEDGYIGAEQIRGIYHTRIVLSLSICGFHYKKGHHCRYDYQEKYQVEP